MLRARVSRNPRASAKPPTNPPNQGQPMIFPENMTPAEKQTNGGPKGINVLLLFWVFVIVILLF